MENTIKITKTQKLNAIIAILDNADINSIVIPVGEDEVEVTKEDLVEYCEKEIEALAKKAAKAKETAAKKKAEDPLLDIVKAALTSEPQTIADIATKVVEVNADATTAKVTARLTKLINAGEAVRSEVSVANSEGKKRTVKAYALAE
jgi:thioesterase domain-containing protein